MVDKLRTVHHTLQRQKHLQTCLDVALELVSNVGFLRNQSQAGLSACEGQAEAEMQRRSKKEISVRSL